MQGEMSDEPPAKKCSVLDWKSDKWHTWAEQDVPKSRVNAMMASIRVSYAHSGNLVLPSDLLQDLQVMFPKGDHSAALRLARAMLTNLKSDLSSGDDDGDCRYDQVDFTDFKDYPSIQSHVNDSQSSHSTVTRNEAVYLAQEFLLLDAAYSALNADQVVLSQEGREGKVGAVLYMARTALNRACGAWREAGE